MHFLQLFHIIYVWYELSESIKKRYRNVLNKERGIGERISHSVITSPPLSVWEIIIPLIFIFKMIRTKKRYMKK